MAAILFRHRRVSFSEPGSGLILGWHPANKRHRYIVMLSLIGWALTWNHPCDLSDKDQILITIEHVLWY